VGRSGYHAGKSAQHSLPPSSPSLPADSTRDIGDIMGTKPKGIAGADTFTSESLVPLLFLGRLCYIAPTGSGAQGTHRAPAEPPVPRPVRARIEELPDDASGEANPEVKWPTPTRPKATHRKHGTPPLQPVPAEPVPAQHSPPVAAARKATGAAPQPPITIATTGPPPAPLTAPTAGGLATPTSGFQPPATFRKAVCPVVRRALCRAVFLELRSSVVSDFVGTQRAGGY